MIPAGGSVNILSPNFPDDYASNTYCFWTIKAETGKQVWLAINSFMTGECSVKIKHDFSVIMPKYLPKLFRD